MSQQIAREWIERARTKLIASDIYCTVSQLLDNQVEVIKCLNEALAELEENKNKEAGND